MADESSTSPSCGTKSKLKARPKPVVLWTSSDVEKWLRRCCSDLFSEYHQKFVDHEITGRTLLRLDDNSLRRIGIDNSVHRELIWREILKLQLKTDILSFRDAERRVAINIEWM